MNTKLDRIAHRGKFNQFDSGRWNDPHVEEMLAQSTAATDIGDERTLSRF